MFKKSKSRRLRWHLLQPLAITFVLLWLGTMIMFTSNTCHEMESSVKNAAQSVQNSMKEHYEYYTRNYASGLEEEACNILSINLSDLSVGQVSELDGGIAFVMSTATEYVRSQLAWGWGHQEGIDLGQRWYFSFDEGLDDQGQIALANWIIEHRNNWAYIIYPQDDEYGNNSNGSFARVTGIERPGYEIAVQKIEIIHPDGIIDTMVETTTEGSGNTWDFTYINVCSVLLPAWNSNGKNDFINMERRLASFREAHSVLDREIAGEYPSVLTKDGFSMGSRYSNGVVDFVAVQCNVLPAVLKQNSGLYISTALLTLSVLLLLSAKLSRQVTLPVETLCREAAEGVCQTDTSIQELNTLAIAFNTTQDKLKKQLDREREFTRSAAHELKTPLAILRAHAEYAQEDILPEKRNSYLEIVLEESDRMADLVSNLLDLTRLQSGLSLNIASVELSHLIKDIWKPMALALEQKKISLSMEMENLYIDADEGNLRKIVSNLASNALHHTPEGGEIRVTLKKQDDKIILSVYNDGSQIPENALPRLWEPFYRVDKAHNRSDGGSGLGLAIVHAAVLAHGGTCEVENRPNGVCFHIILPHNLKS